jgi:hypothetical protein
LVFNGRFSIEFVVVVLGRIIVDDGFIVGGTTIRVCFGVVE